VAVNKSDLEIAIAAKKGRQNVETGPEMDIPSDKMVDNLNSAPTIIHACGGLQSPRRSQDTNREEPT
jgi:hypothetical protein